MQVDFVDAQKLDFVARRKLISGFKESGGLHRSPQTGPVGRLPPPEGRLLRAPEGPRAGLSPQLPLRANVFRPCGTLHARRPIWGAFSRKRCVVCSKKRSLFGPAVLGGQKICDDQQRYSALARGIAPQRRAIPQYGCDGSRALHLFYRDGQTTRPAKVVGQVPMEGLLRI